MNKVWKKPTEWFRKSRTGRWVVAHQHTRWFVWGKRTAAILLALAGFFFVLDTVFPFRVQVDYAQLITARDGSVLYGFLSHDDKWRMKTELHEITPELRKAIIHKEDRFFYYHLGVNPIAIARAAANNIFTGRKTSGASTITMQVARLLQPKERTYGNKLVEVFRAVQLEWHFSKDEILQLYLNLVPYGGNVEGVKSAALLYFGQLPNRLSVAQITALAIVPNRPTSLSLNRNSTLLQQERDKWLRRFEENSVFEKSVIQDALNEPLQVKRTPLPAIAPHLSYRLHTKYVQVANLHTTLNRITQDKVQQLAYNYHKRLQKYNIHNLAVIVADNQTHEMLAYVGSPDFYDNDHAGQVDNARAIRSPGSTLKPLVYALGIDAGKITPKTQLLDVPSQFDGYAPENFDQKFNGAVTVENSLINSLNIPAVKVLEDITVPAFVAKLKAARFEQIARDEHKLGLSSILGGCGTTLEELVALYTAFANGGNYSPLKNLKSESQDLPNSISEKTKTSSIQLISTQSAYMINEILMQAVRPDLPTGYQNSYHAPPIAWKTGTSYGRKDAWSIGYNRRYTVGVWVGNANAEGVPELTGADIATPLLFQVFNSVDYNAAGSRLLAPKNLQMRLVCGETGLLPSDQCTHQVVDYYIPLVSNTQTCKHLKKVAVSPDESFSYCTTCLPENGYKKQLYENLPPALVSFYNTWGVAYKRIPPHNPACTRVFHSDAPEIVTPADGREYLVDVNEPPEMLLTCHADNDVKQVYWYVNDRFYKAAKATERVFFLPEPGEIKISCSDDKGRNTDIKIVVKKM